MKTFPRTSALMEDGKMKDFIEGLRSSGLEVNHDKDAGTVTARDGDDAVVFRAIQKGANGQPWIAMFINSAIVTWRHDMAVLPRDKCDICESALPSNSVSTTCPECLRSLIVNAVPGEEGE